NTGRGVARFLTERTYRYGKCRLTVAKNRIDKNEHNNGPAIPAHAHSSQTTLDRIDQFTPLVSPRTLRKASWAVQLNEHVADRGDVVFRQACKLGLEGIVSKRLGSPYRSGRSRHWLKSKSSSGGEAGSRNDEADALRLPT